MIYLAKIGFWLSAICLVHTYVLYPFLLKLGGKLSKKKAANSQVYTQNDADLPFVTVVMSAFNEEKVISEKIKTLLDPEYPSHKYRIFIGSDASTDATNDLIQGFADRISYLHFTPFADRRGKPPVVNDLVAHAQSDWGNSANHIVLFTDASVLLEKKTVFQLAQHFKNSEIALVDANILPLGLQQAGISEAENQYLRAEVEMKYLEGLIWQRMLGPLGGCYALRIPFFRPIPPRFLVDDFYIAMRAFELGGSAINELNARCYEAVSDEISVEYRRKRRISAGNFQNLATFHKLLWRFDALSFVFFSHKVLRWLGPFFILFCLISSGILATRGNFFYQILFGLQLLFIFFVPLLDKFLSYFNVHISFLRAWRYLLLMNMALAEGFKNYCLGVKSNIWQPTARK
jgi:cellulose synthase/poly-beta-1,6-N-acetylglucosamine synthase-like glycosyltransferase